MIGGRNELPPPRHANDRTIDPDVDDGNGDGADHDRPWNDAPRIAHFVADVADVVVAEVVVDTNASCRAKAEEKSEREVESARRKVECKARIEMRSAGENHR